jgi:malonyl-CoA decarboxylase
LSENSKIEECNTAILYSISSTQPGLNGVNLGNFLIKNVVEQLKNESNFIIHLSLDITIFSTLSPIPGFMKWLAKKLENEEISFDKNEIELLKSLGTKDENPWTILRKILSKKLISNDIESIMMRLCSNYLYNEKKKDSKKILDEVANFHVRNGAIMYRLNWRGDESENGINLSYGMMVNYKYDLDSIDQRNEDYIVNGIIGSDESFQKELK